MALLNCDAILTRARELIDGFGSYRQIAGGRFEVGLPDGLDDAEASRRSMSWASADPRIGGIRPHPANPSRLHSLAIYEIDVDVVVVRHLNDKHRLSSSYRDDVLALAAQDGDALAQCFEYLGNFSATEAGVPTGLVSGLLTHVDSAVSRVSLGDQQPGLVEYVHRFTGVVQVTRYAGAGE